MASQINDKCNMCGVCESVCPTKSISRGGRTFIVDSDTCTNCLLCAQVCPMKAVENPLLPKPKKRKKRIKE